MTDDFSTDTVPISPPSEHVPAPSPLPDTSEIINQNRHAALTQLAKDESIEGYAQEREDQAAVIDRGEDIPQERQNQWFRRASKALQDAALEAQGITTNEQGEQEPQEAPSGYIPANEVEGMLDQERKTAQARMRVDQYFGGNTERKGQIVNWHEAMDPESVCAQWVIDSGTPVAGQLMERLADHPEELQEIAQMPPQRDRLLGNLEGKIMAEAQMAQQLAGQQQQWQQDRRTSKAPPPIRPPRGGANPPSDIHQLASRGDDVTSYVRARQAMEKKRDY